MLRSGGGFPASGSLARDVSRDTGLACQQGSVGIGYGAVAYEASHQIRLPLLDAGVSEGHLDGKGEVDPRFHLAQALPSAPDPQA